MQREQWRAAQTKKKGKGSAAVMDWGMVETSEAAHSPLFTCDVNSGEQPKRKRRRRGRGGAVRRWWTKGRWKRQRPITLQCSHAMGTLSNELIHYQLFTLQNSGECRRQWMRRRRGSGRAARWRERRRPVVKGSCSPLMDSGPSFFPLFFLFSFSPPVYKK